MSQQSVIVLGCGIAGIATAHYLSRKPGIGRVTIIDQGQPMAFTSAQSGENYRNWWPHPTMTAFTDLSITLMEELARETGNGFNMTRRGYVLATRDANIDPLVETLYRGYSDAGRDAIRFHGKGSSRSYMPPTSPDWTAAPDGVDVLTDHALIRETFPSYDPEVRALLHIRRAGDVSGQLLGTIMLDVARATGARRVTGMVTDARSHASGFTVTLRTPDGVQDLFSDILVNAAGPFLGHIGQMLGYDLPVENVRQQKIAFEDRHGVIPRNMPFSIDLDAQTIDWDDEDRALLADDPETAWLAAQMPGAIHCKAEGGEHGAWIKLGWAYTSEPSDAQWAPELDPRFPEIVLHGAARLNPGLKRYYGHLPRQMSHYGGYYTMTPENWPLIGPAGPEGSFVVGALSGFGTMAACASGHIAAEIITGGTLPDYGTKLTLARYDDADFVDQLKEMAQSSVL